MSGGRSPILQAGATRRDSYAIDPRQVVLYGHDKGWRLGDPGVTRDHPCFNEFRLAKLADKEKVNALALSFIAAGRVLQPPEVIIEKRAEPIVICLYGNRRTLACRVAGDMLEKSGQPRMFLPVQSPESGSPAELWGMVIGENSNREDDAPSVKAKQLQKLLRLRGDDLAHPSKDSIKEAMRLFGDVDESTIRNWITLGGLEEPVQKMVDAGLPQNIARTLQDLPADKQIESARELKERHERGETNLLAKARSNKNKASGKASADDHEGLTRGEMIALFRLIQEDKSAGVEIELPDDAVKFLLAAIGKGGTERVRGLNRYLARIKDKKNKKNKTGDRAAE